MTRREPSKGDRAIRRARRRPEPRGSRYRRDSAGPAQDYGRTGAVTYRRSIASRSPGVVTGSRQLKPRQT